MKSITDPSSARRAARAVSADSAIRPVVPQAPALPRAQARLMQYLGRGRSFSLASRNAVLTVTAAPSIKPKWSKALHVGGPFGSIVIADGARLMRALGDIDLDNESGADAARWQWLQAAVLGRLGDTPFSCADSLSCASLSKPGKLTVLRIELRGAQHVIATHAGAPAQVWLDFMQRSAWAADCLPMDSFAGLPLTAAVRVARHTLPAHAARVLAAGDIIVPDTPLFSCAGEGAIRLGALTAQVRFQPPSALTILYTEGNMNQNYQDDGQEEDFDDSIYDEGSEEYDDEYADASEEGADEDYGDENDMGGSEEDGEGEEDEQEFDDDYAEHDEDDADVESDGAPDPEPETRAGARTGAARQASGAARARRPIDLDKTPVSLAFELGRVRLTLGELRALDAGSVLEIAGGSPQSIAIVSSGRKLGTGELVDIDGQLGIRVVEWNAAS